MTDLKKCCSCGVAKPQSHFKPSTRDNCTVCHSAIMEEQMLERKAKKEAEFQARASGDIPTPKKVTAYTSAGCRRKIEEYFSNKEIEDYYAL